jgi:hypothetical protein
MVTGICLYIFLDDIRKGKEEKLRYDVEEFSSITISAKKLDVEIIEAENYYVECYSYGKNEPEVYVTSNMLKIIQDDFKESDNKNNGCRVVIGIPDSKTILHTNIKVEDGNVDMKDIISTNISINNNIGKICLDNITSISTKIDVNVGDINIEGRDIKFINATGIYSNITMNTGEARNDRAIQLSSVRGKVYAFGTEGLKKIEDVTQRKTANLNTVIGDVYYNNDINNN